MPGWHGKENGQKAEMDKKRKSKWKTIFEENVSIISACLGHVFLPFLPLSILGPFPFRLPLFPFPAFGLHHLLFLQHGRISLYLEATLQQANKLHCNIENAALQESGAFWKVFCRFPVDFGLPRLGSHI